MTEGSHTETNDRWTLLSDPATVLRAAAAMGRVMLVVRSHGATHERIGPIGAVTVQDGAVRLSGGAHDASVDGAAITAIVADRSGRMKDKALPRLEFLGANEEPLFRVIGLDGLEPFDAALAHLARGASSPQKSSAESKPATLIDGDPGASPFVAAANAGVEISVELRRAGVIQRWSGIVEAMKPAMGFINIIKPDFHLHLRGGGVARWNREELSGETLLIAETPDGESTGLIVRGPASALAGA